MKTKTRAYPRLKIAIGALSVLLTIAWIVKSQRPQAQPDWISFDDTQLREYFYDKAPAAWKKYQNRLSRLRVEYDIHANDLAGQILRNGEYILRNGEYIVNGKCQMFRLPNKRIACQNPDYQFVIANKDGEGWQLESFSRRDQKVDGDMALAFNAAPKIVGRSLMIQNSSLPEMVASGVFSIEKASVVESGEHHFVRIDFTGDFGGRGIDWQVNDSPIVRSYVVLDPENHWIIVSAAAWDESKTGFVAKYYYRFDGPLPHVPVPVLYTSLLDFDSAGGGWMEGLGGAYDKYDFHFEQHPLSKFRLPAFGIEEPDGE